MDQELVVVQGAVFDVIGVNELVIAELNKRYLPMKINGKDDKEGYKAVHEGIQKYVKARTMVGKHGKATRDKAIKYQRDVIAEEKRVIGLLAPGEEHLRTERKAIDDIELAIKAEAEAREAARVQSRIDRLESMGMGLIAGHYKLPYNGDGVAIPVAILKVCTDEQFTQFVGQIQGKKDAEDARVKAEKEVWEAERVAFAKVAADQETERLRLAEVARKQTEEAGRIKAEQQVVEREKQKLIEDEAARAAAVDREKKRVEDEKQRAEEIEKVKAEAIEEGKRKAEQKAQEEKEFCAKMEEKARIAAEKKLARAPDREKLLQYADYIAGVPTPPELKSIEAKDIVTQTQTALSFTIQTLREKAEAL